MVCDELQRQTTETPKMTKKEPASTAAGDQPAKKPRKPRTPATLVFTGPTGPASLDAEIAAVSERTHVPVDVLRGIVRAEGDKLLASLRGRVLAIYSRSVGLEATGQHEIGETLHAGPDASADLAVVDIPPA